MAGEPQDHSDSALKDNHQALETYAGIIDRHEETGKPNPAEDGTQSGEPNREGAAREQASTASSSTEKPLTGEAEGQTAWCRGSTFDETAHAAAAVAMTAVAKRPAQNEKGKDEEDRRNGRRTVTNETAEATGRHIGSNRKEPDSLGPPARRR